jgi:cytochrome c oxidase cbb3-type subunit 3
MSTFWSIFVIVLVVINVGGCVWLIAWTMNMNTAEQDDDSTGHTWDGDLKEYNNPLPKWWLNTFYLSIIFTVIYLALYPGLGNFKGLLGWTLDGQYEEQLAASRAQYEEVYAAFVGISLEDLATNPDALRLGRNTYMNNCASCHGSDGRGAKSFPNLTDDNWLWGGDAATVQQTIAQGRVGNMPALGAVAGEEGVEQIITYLLSDTGDSSAEVAAGKQKFMTSGCIGCHGVNAEGNPILGAPNLRDADWLHGSSREDIRDTINNGRVNQMPAHLDLIGEDRVRMVAAYVLSLSQD